MTTTKEAPAADDATFDVEAWLSGATRPESVIMLSSKGHEVGQFKALEQELLAAQKASDDESDQRLTSGADVRRIALEMDALSKIIEKGRRQFRLRGLNEDDLKKVRAITKDLEEEDTQEHMMAVCCVNPVMTAEQWTKLRMALGEGQWTQTIREANRVSFGEAADVPFSLAQSVALKTQEF